MVANAAIATAFSNAVGIVVEIVAVSFVVVFFRYGGWTREGILMLTLLLLLLLLM